MKFREEPPMGKLPSAGAHQHNFIPNHKILIPGNKM